MSLTRFIKDLLRKPESIPTPGAIFYNATVAKVLRKPETKIANDIVAKTGKGTILDLGSGTGYLSIEIAKRSTGLQVYGIDLSRQMVKIARRHAKGVDNAQFVYGNAAKLPFKDKSIDLVVSTGALHHWRAPRLVFDECYRVLKTGAEAWIYDGCPEVFRDKAARTKLYEEYGFLIGRFGPRVSTLHGFTRDEYQTVIKDMLEQTAFKGNYQMALTDIWMKMTLKKHH
ncbi:MAG: methyltransferase domain-containing protein [Dehalococcoidia bacterium]|nr:methyltransferase domain-containing protein [Dehalococcoidia bacterium]